MMMDGGRSGKGRCCGKVTRTPGGEPEKKLGGEGKVLVGEETRPKLSRQVQAWNRSVRAVDSHTHADGTRVGYFHLT